MKWNKLFWFRRSEMCLCDEAFCFLITLQSLLPWLCGPDCSVGVENEYYLNKFYLYSPQYRSDLTQFYIFQPLELTSHLTPWRPIFGRLTLDTSAAPDGKLIWKFNIYVNADGIEAGSGILNQYLLFRVWLVTARPAQASRAPSPVSPNIYVQKKPSRLFIFNCWKLSAILK